MSEAARVIPFLSGDDLTKSLPPQTTLAMQIDLGAVVHNYRFLSSQLTRATCSAVVKANSYGLGVDPIAKSLAQAGGCKDFYVATIEEGIRLRRTLENQRIFVFNGVLPGTEDLFFHHNLIPVLNDLGQVSLWQSYARRLENKLPAVLHVDTGMWRTGLPPEEVRILAQDLDRLQGLNISYIMSHLACSERPTHEKNIRQWHLFRKILESFPNFKASFANSNGIFLGPQYHFDQVRPGRCLYGLGINDIGIQGLKPVIRIFAKILQVREVSEGETIGYDASYYVSRSLRLATVAIGFADGLLRSLTNRGALYVGEILAPILGRVSMDLITIDVTNIPEEKSCPGSWIEVMGHHMFADEMAQAAGTTSREIISRFGERYHRIYTQL